MTNDNTIAAFELALSHFIAGSELSAYDALIAAGISLARVIYGLELLHGKPAAMAACALLDETMTSAWHKLANKPEVLQ